MPQDGLRDTVKKQSEELSLLKAEKEEWNKVSCRQQ